MSLSFIVLIIVALLLVGALPAWPYSSAWGYWPSGDNMGAVLLVVLILLLLGRV